MYFKFKMKDFFFSQKSSVLSKSYFLWNTITVEQFQQALVASELRLPV